MRQLVTGAAGFIGSHVAEQLLSDGHDVVGVDCFIPYYPRQIKEANLAGLVQHPRFRFHELDLRSADLSSVLDGVDTVFHLAAMAGLSASWSDFESYMTCNLPATQRVLQARPGHDPPAVARASNSSVSRRRPSGGRPPPPQPT